MNDLLPDSSTPRAVVVDAPARLHIGFTDLNGGLGRRFGSLGLTLGGLSTELRLQRSDTLNARGRGAGRALRWAELLLDQLRLEAGVDIELVTAIPAHVGLGSGTQLALAVGSAIGRVFGLDISPQQVAQRLGRGARSGVGIGAFEHGGFLLDGGRDTNDLPPPITARFAFPPPWRVLLVLDENRKGLFGVREKTAFQALPSFSETQAGTLCRLVLMQILPSLAQAQWEPFAAAIGSMQDIVGDQFAQVQGGRYSSDDVAKVLAWCRNQGLRGVGQSSWGPTGFIILNSETHAHALLREVKSRFGTGTLSFRVAAGRNHGASVHAFDQHYRDAQRVTDNYS